MNNVAFNSLAGHICIFLALLRRDLKMLKQKFHTIFIDSAVVLFVNIILFGHLFPLFGMPDDFIAPLYLGTVVGFMFFLGYSQALTIVFDMQYNRFIDYRITLPLPKRWLFAEHIVFCMIETMIITFPLMSLGIMFLGPLFTPVNPQWSSFIVMYILTTLFFALFFASASFLYDPDYFRMHLWPRRLSPLFSFSANFLIWKKVYVFSPNIGYLLLLNPTVYLTEGLRSALLNEHQYIPFYICINVALLFIILFIGVLTHGIKKRLDPV